MSNISAQYKSNIQHNKKDNKETTFKGLRTFQTEGDLRNKIKRQKKPFELVCPSGQYCSKSQKKSIHANLGDVIQCPKQNTAIKCGAPQIRPEKSAVEQSEHLLQSQANLLEEHTIGPKECRTDRYYERDREREQFNGLVSSALNNMLFVWLL